MFSSLLQKQSHFPKTTKGQFSLTIIVSIEYRVWHQWLNYENYSNQMTAVTVLSIQSHLGRCKAAAQPLNVYFHSIYYISYSFSLKMIAFRVQGHWPLNFRILFTFYFNTSSTALSVHGSFIQILNFNIFLFRARLNVCFSYTSRDEICAAMREVTEGVQLGLIKER